MFIDFHLYKFFMIKEYLNDFIIDDSYEMFDANYDVVSTLIHLFKMVHYV
jgi:hypothetical protein